jgi:hypothetical protein
MFVTVLVLKKVHLRLHVPTVMEPVKSEFLKVSFRCSKHVRDVVAKARL